MEAIVDWNKSGRINFVSIIMTGTVVSTSFHTEKGCSIV